MGANGEARGGRLRDLELRLEVESEVALLLLHVIQPRLQRSLALPGCREQRAVLALVAHELLVERGLEAPRLRKHTGAVKVIEVVRVLDVCMYIHRSSSSSRSRLSRSVSRLVISRTKASCCLPRASTTCAASRRPSSDARTSASCKACRNVIELRKLLP